MNVKELEERTGLPRASIRFYEQQGLLSPERLPNGYRNYSQEDLITLEKIHLLRSLGLEVRTIRMLQENQITLQQALFGQLNALEGEKVQLNRAAQLCRDLENSGEEYETLDPARWLPQLDAAGSRESLAVCSETEKASQEESPEAVEQGQPSQPEEFYESALLHPWMRYFARRVDMVLWGMLLLDLPLLMANLRAPTDPLLPGILSDIVLLAASLLAETVLLHFWGWTPGKWLFGLRLRTPQGEKLGIREAGSRCLRLARNGVGFGIPLWELWKMVQSYRTSREGISNTWDFPEQRRYSVESRPGGSAFYTAGLLLISAVGFFLTAFTLVAYVWIASVNPPSLEECEALWAKSQAAEPAAGVTVTYPFDAELFEMEPAHSQVTFSHDNKGRVTAVIEKHFTENEFVLTYAEEYDALFSMLGIDPETLSSGDPGGWGAMFSRLDAYDAETEYRGLRITQKLIEDGVSSADSTVQVVPSGGIMKYNLVGNDISFTRRVTITFSDRWLT